jgi:hypothetical protein
MRFCSERRKCLLQQLEGELKGTSGLHWHMLQYQNERLAQYSFNVRPWGTSDASHIAKGEQPNPRASMGLWWKYTDARDTKIQSTAVRRKVN